MKDTILEKDTIVVDIGDDHSFNCTAVTIGRTGEHDVSQLEINIPTALNGFWAFLDFKKPDGTTVKTEMLDIVGNKIEYDISNGLLDKSGNFEVQLVLQNKDGEVWKSATKKFVVLKSIDAADFITEKEDFISEAQNTLNTLAEVSASAVTGTVSSAVVVMPDVSPVSHILDVELLSKNIWDEIWELGFIGTYDGINATSDKRVRSKNYISCKANTTYSYSIANDNIVFYFYDKNKKFLSYKYPYKSKFETVEKACYMRFVLPEEYGKVYNNDIAIVEGATVPKYTPYIETEDVTLTRCGKNLLNISSIMGKSVTENGATLTCGADGGITGSGTATDYVGFKAIRQYLPIDTYILSASGEFSQLCCSVGIKDANGTLLCDANVTHAGQTVIFNLASYPTYSYLEIVCKRNNNAELSGTAYFQLEQGTVATEYERYKGTDYIGTFENVSSLYPTTALVTNTEGVIIRAKYNKDTNKVIAALLSLVQGGGGRISYIDLPSAKWQGSASPYSQVVSITGITENSKVDINPSIEQLAIFHTKDIAFVAENEDGVVTVYCIGQKPTADYQMQITITEVLANG